MRTRVERNNLESLVAVRERVFLYSTWNLPTRPHTSKLLENKQAKIISFIKHIQKANYKQMYIT